MEVAYSRQSGTYCPIFDSWVDDYLVNEAKPDCIEKNKGCGNCPDVRNLVEEKINGKKKFTVKKIINR